jgi:hypothetical protein
VKKRKKRNKILLTILLVLALGVIGLGIGRMAGRLVGARPAGSEGHENQGLGSQGQGSAGQEGDIGGDAEMSGISDLSSKDASSMTESGTQQDPAPTKTPTPSPEPTSSPTPTPTPMPTRESLNDISVQDMSAYLGEMPPDGTDIVGTDTVDYTYEEVAKDLPTTIVAASKDMEAAEYVQHAFMNDVMRVYTNEDVLGVELCGAMKNIIALAAGISAGIDCT